MDIRELAQQVEEKYRRYLKTTFYFKDPDLRTSFEEALQSWHLSKGLFIEATPVFKRTTTPRDLFTELLGRVPEQGLLEAVLGERPLYYHQEQAVRQIFGGKNVVIATGTGSGKTEAFLLPVLLQLYREYQAGILGPGVRALILYPMNALANDQRDRLGEICSRLAESRSPFRFTFGQYIGETPKDKNDTRRHASSHEANRLPGELVFRTEMWNEPPHILLTNYSMLEYLLLRPEDSALFDRGRARWWRFIILDEAHQYRGSRGIEMAMLLRRLKQRLREGGRNDTFQCIATSATLAGGGDDCAAVAKFASDLFNESFDQTNLIMGETEPFSSSSSHDMTPDQYLTLKEALETKVVSSSLVELAKRLGIASLEEEIEKVAGKILQQDGRALRLYNQISVEPVELEEIAVSVFDDSPEELRVEHLLILINLLLKAEFPISGAPLLSARYHLFLRSLEGAFVTYYPYKKVYLDRKLQGENTAAFEVALCRECGQHYFVGPKNFQEGKLGEAVRDPSHPEFGATFFRPLDDEIVSDEEWGNNNTSNHGYVLCMRCGKMSRSQPDCGHLEIIPIIREESPTDEDRADQMARCGACGYNAAGRDPVREVVHGTDGPHAVISTTLYQNLPDGRKKILAFADSRQEAAFFAWYLG